MNRPIKFRAWDGVEKEMLPSIFEKVIINRRGEVISQSQLKVMQFTGLLDKNGKEIYEGDIVKLHCSSNEDHIITATVAWYAELAKFYPAIHDKKVLVVGGSQEGKKVSMGEMHSWCGSHHCFSYPSYLEIIGNIYENPELITTL